MTGTCTYYCQILYLFFCVNFFHYLLSIRLVICYQFFSLFVINDFRYLDQFILLFVINSFDVICIWFFTGLSFYLAPLKLNIILWQVGDNALRWQPSSEFVDFIFSSIFLSLHDFYSPQVSELSDSDI